FFILGAYVLYPSLRTFWIGIAPEVLGALFSSWSSANVRGLFNSVYISIATVLGAGVVGTALAYFFYRFHFPLRNTLVAIAALPLALPPLVGVLAFLFLYGQSGILPRGIQAIFGLAQVPFSFEGLWAVWLVHVYTMYVYFYLFVMSALGGIDRGLFEASADLGASGFSTFRRVVLPQLQPALVGASLLVFMISMASFTAPLLFAGTENFLTLQIYNYKTNGNLELSAAVSSVLTLICLGFLLVLEFGDRGRRTGSAGKGVAATASAISEGWARAAAFVAALLILILLLLPIA